MSASNGPTPPQRRRRALLSARAMAYGPRLAQMVIVRRCNLECGYCNEYDKTSEPVPAATVKAWVDRLAELSCLFVEFTGGETLLHPDLPELVAYASSYKFLERWIITNGYLLSPSVIQRLNDAGLTHLQISVDGVTPNTTTVKVLEPLRKKLEHLEKHARFEVQVNAVLGAGNDAEVLDVVRYAKQAGFVPRVLVIHDHSGASCLDAKGKELLAKVYDVVGAKWNEAGDYRTRIVNEGSAPFRCRAGARYLYIDEFGVVNWCSQQRGVFGKPLLDYEWTDLKQQFYTAKPCSETCTVGCARTASRFDEWRGQPNEPPRAKLSVLPSAARRV